MHLLVWAVVGWVTFFLFSAKCSVLCTCISMYEISCFYRIYMYMYLHMLVCCVYSERKHVECVMKDNVAVVRLNSPNSKVHVHTCRNTL